MNDLQYLTFHKVIYAAYYVKVRVETLKLLIDLYSDVFKLLGAYSKREVNLSLKSMSYFVNLMSAAFIYGQENKHFYTHISYSYMHFHK